MRRQREEGSLESTPCARRAGFGVQVGQLQDSPSEKNCEVLPLPLLLFTSLESFDSQMLMICPCAFPPASLPSDQGPGGYRDCARGQPTTFPVGPHFKHQYLTIVFGRKIVSLWER